MAAQAREVQVKDVLYVIGSVAFFALLVWYLNACERLGTRAPEEENAP